MEVWWVIIYIDSNGWNLNGSLKSKCGDGGDRESNYFQTKYGHFQRSYNGLWFIIYESYLWKTLTLRLNESYWLEPRIHGPSADQQDFWKSGPGRTRSGEKDPKIHINPPKLHSSGRIWANPICIPIEPTIGFSTMWVLTAGWNLTSR